MIRVLYLQPACDLYGSSQSLLRLLRGFPRDAVDPFVVLPDRGPLETPLASIGAQVLVEKSLPVIRRASFSARGMLSLVASSAASIAGLSRLMRDLGIDLVHMNSSLVATGGLAAKLAGRPSVWHVRETHLMSKPALWRLYSRYVCATSDAIICVSTAARSQFGDLGPRSKSLSVIPNGLPLNEFDAALALRPGARFREDLGVRSDERLIGVVGRISELKAQHVAINAFAALPHKVRSKSRLVLAGDAHPSHESYQEYVKGLVRREGLSDRVHFCGFRADIVAVLDALDILVVSSRYDAFPGVVLEAMACQVPVIATAVGGVVDQIEHGVSGMLVSPGDHDAIALRIEELLKDAALAARLGGEGRRRVAAEFSLAKTAAATLKVYGQVIG